MHIAQNPKIIFRVICIKISEPVRDMSILLFILKKLTQKIKFLFLPYMELLSLVLARVML